MILTPLRSFRIPEPQGSLLNHKKIYLPSCNFAGDLLAWISGEELAPIVPIRDDILADLPGLGLIPPNQPSRMLRVRSQGDEGNPPLQVPVLYLRRRFQLIDDYLGDFPEADSIELSLSYDEALSVLQPNEYKRVEVSKWLQALEYLNPKDPTHYFFRSTIGVPRELIERYASLIPEEVRWNIVKTRRNRDAETAPLPPLPNEGRGLSFLACIFENYSDLANLRLFFHEYPSYLTLAAMPIADDVSNPRASERAKDFIETLVLNTDYSKYDEIEYVPDSIYANFVIQLLCILSRVSDWKQAKRVLTMIGIRHTLFGNVDDYVPGPYLHSVDPNLAEFTVHHPFVVNLNELLQVPASVVLEALQYKPSPSLVV